MGFWDTLRKSPSPHYAVAQGNNALFVCDIRGTRPSSSAVDYREPGPGIPGGRISDGLTNPSWPIGCDRAENHAALGGEDITVLYFSGSVKSVTRSSPEWVIAMQYTTDPK